MKKSEISPLSNKIILIRPVARKSSWPYIVNQSTAGKHLWPGASIKLTGTPFDINKGQYVEPLTSSEREWFESESSTLGFTPGFLLANKPITFEKGKANYWAEYSVTLFSEDLKLRLSDPFDFLKYKFLCTYPNIIAPSEDEIRMLEHLYYIEEEGLGDVKKASRTEETVKAYKLLEPLMNKEDSMRTFLRLWDYSAKGTIAKLEGVGRATLISKMESLLYENPYKFNEVLEDANYKHRALVLEMFDKGVILYKKMSNNKMGFAVGELMFHNIDAVVEFLNNPKNQGTYTQLLAELDKK